MRKRKRRGLFDMFFSPFEEFEELFEREIPPAVGGYSIQVTQVGGKTIVRAKVGKGTDTGELRRYLETRYPGAQIIIEGGEPLIKELKEEEPEESRKPEERKLRKVAIEWIEPRKKPLIEEVKEEK